MRCAGIALSGDLLERLGELSERRPAVPCRELQQAEEHLRRDERVAAGGVPILRDDGTYPATVTSQFAVRMDILRNHALWVERSTNFMFGNTYEIPEGQQKYKLTENTPVRNIAPLSFWPRSEPDDFPRVVELTGELPPWFKL
jgi:hypothetical protein